MTSNNSVSVNITFRNTQGTDALKNYATEKITNCLKKFVHRDTEVHLVLIVEKNHQIAEVAFSADGNRFACKEESKDLYTSIDALVKSLSGQLRKHKEKLVNHHK